VNQQDHRRKHDHQAVLNQRGVQPGYQATEVDDRSAQSVYGTIDDMSVGGREKGRYTAVDHCIQQVAIESVQVPALAEQIRQQRDALHPADLAGLLATELQPGQDNGRRRQDAGGHGQPEVVGRRPRTADKAGDECLQRFLKKSQHQGDTDQPPHYNGHDSLTAGWDSRTILALSRKWLPEFFIYTHQMRKMDVESPDIVIPKAISKKLGFEYHILDCQQEVDDEFRKLYQSSSDLPHDDWLKIANGLYKYFPKERIVLAGNISEIARCSLYKDGHHEEVTSPIQLAVDWIEWREIPYIQDYMGKWLAEAKDLCENYHIDVYDLWYMELFMGGWLTRNFNESDVVFEKFTPYNFRPWVTKMWGVPVKYRLHDHPVIYGKILEKCWPELLYWPFNPPHWNKKFRLKYFVADKLKKIGLYNGAYKVYNKLHPVYMKMKS